jgi:hypothetical protein
MRLIARRRGRNFRRLSGFNALLGLIRVWRTKREEEG